MLLFRIDNKGIFLHPDAIKLEPSLGKLPSEDLLYIVLRYDYFSPYGQMNESQRALSSSRRCFDNDDFVKHDRRLKKEIECYNGLQYDIRRETNRNYQAKIAGLNLALMATDSPTEIKKYHEAIEYLTKAVRKREHDLYTDEMTDAASYDPKMSFLERYMDNKRRFKEDSRLMAGEEAKRNPIQSEEI